jgi:dihydrofolate synthase / folylpolyglutamate synthase
MYFVVWHFQTRIQVVAILTSAFICYQQIPAQLKTIYQFVKRETRIILIPMDFFEAIRFLENFPDMERGRTGASMSLDSMHLLLSLLGDPHLNRKTIHVTGSKGKGSTSLFMASILNEAGYSTALYTSPHLHSYQERIAFDLQPVNEETFAKGVTRLAEALDAETKERVGAISTFGLLTALFFLLVEERARLDRQVDWQIVEVGLGGTHDATNVFASKELAVFTPISIEHAAILGKTPGAIAANKAGIITSGCTTILSKQDDALAKETIQTASQSAHSSLIDVDKQYRSERIRADLHGQTFKCLRGAEEDLFTTKMLGDHQITNATTAIAAIEALKLPQLTSDKSILVRGVGAARLNGRFEVLQYSRTFVLDGAHNEDSARALANALTLYFPGRKIVFILGLNKDKSVDTIWKHLKVSGNIVIATRTENARAVSPEELAEQLKSCDANAQVKAAPDAATALQLALNEAGEPIICVTGSLYLVAELRNLIYANRPKTASLTT